MDTAVLIDKAIREQLLDAGATIVGYARLGRFLHDDIAHLDMAISIGVGKNLNRGTLALLGELQRKTSRILKESGYRYLCIPPDSDRVKDTFVSRLYPFFAHKIAATSSGIGWIGKNGLLINREFGPRLSLATVLTDAPLSADTPIEFSECGDCSLCVEHCPSGAITGGIWSRYEPYVRLINTDKCNSHKKNTKGLSDKPNCGLCINICPYGRRVIKESVQMVLS
jgi:epoxyqueuosine reductase QueG